MNSLSTTTVKKVTTNGINDFEDLLAVEEPLEIRISFFENKIKAEKNLSITMRTPGNDEDLALGFLFTEGIIQHIDQVISVESKSENTVVVSLSNEVEFNMANIERHFYTSSSCGVCGKSSIESVTTSKKTMSNTIRTKFSVGDFYELQNKLRTQQEVFTQTGGLHASALFDSKAELIMLREDVGRHNALDKLIGACVQKNMVPLSAYILLLSGRASFELLQKAFMADIKIVAAIGAPSSLAVEFAKEKDMTLIGFLREDRFNVYCGVDRLFTTEEAGV